VSEELSNEMSESESESEMCCSMLVSGKTWQWAMMHMGKCYRMKQSGHQKDKKVHGVIKHIEKKFQKTFVLV
jgi:hypothetical protein